MAKATTAKSNTEKKKKNAAGSAKAKTAKKSGHKDAASKKKARSKTREGFDGLAKIADHPLVADLLAAGAIAAVAAIAEHQMNKSGSQSSSRLVKSAGKAAAAAMGKKLLGDIGAVTSAAAGAMKKG